MIQGNDDVIENVNDQDTAIFKSSIKYLYNLTENGNLDVDALKSLYRTKCKLMELRRHIVVHNAKSLERCERCFLEPHKYNTKYEIQPIKIGRFAKKVIAKVNSNKVLTKYQNLYYKKLCSQFPNGFDNHNKLVKVCGHCEKKSTLWMKKPKIVNTFVFTNTLENLVGQKKKKKQKKKKRRDQLELASLKLKNDRESSKVYVEAPKNNEDPNRALEEENEPTHSSDRNSMVDSNPLRIFATSDIVPETTSKKKRMKLSKKEGKIIKKVKPVPLSKAEVEVKKKRLATLSEMLKDAGQSKKGPPKLNIFLQSLNK